MSSGCHPTGSLGWALHSSTWIGLPFSLEEGANDTANNATWGSGSNRDRGNFTIGLILNLFHGGNAPEKPLLLNFGLFSMKCGQRPRSAGTASHLSPPWAGELPRPAQRPPPHEAASVPSTATRYSAPAGPKEEGPFRSFLTRPPTSVFWFYLHSLAQQHFRYLLIVRDHSGILLPAPRLARTFQNGRGWAFFTVAMPTPRQAFP